MNRNLKTMRFIPLGIFAVLSMLFVMTSCNDSTTVQDYVGVQKSDPYDPSKPVGISEFTPKSGGVGQQLVISGSNFGNDTSMVNVMIGGKKAVVVNVKNNCLYC